MPSITDALVAFLTILLFYLVHIYRLVQKKYDSKYPPCAPGTMWTNLKNIASSEYFWRMIEIASTTPHRVFQISLPLNVTSHFIVVGDPDIARTILTDRTTIKPSKLYDSFCKVSGGLTIFTSSVGDEEWHKRRKAAAPAFSSRHVRRMTRVALEKTQEWLTNNIDEGQTFDVSKEMLQIILTALTETAFDYQMSKDQCDVLGHDLHLALVEYTRKSPANPFRKFRYSHLVLPERRKAMKAAQSVRDLIFDIMEAYKLKETKEEGTIIQLVMESPKAFPTDDDKIAQLTEFLLVGHETTAFTIAWVLLVISQHAEEQEKLYEDLKRTKEETGEESWSSSCEYLKLVIKEAMRLYPVGRSLRTTKRDFQTPAGLIPKNSVCSFQFLLLFRNPNIFPQPNTFQPTRWIEATKEMDDALFPFSLGKRNCMGQSLGNAEVYAVVARICYEFELEVVDNGKPDVGLVMKAEGAMLRVKKRR